MSIWTDAITLGLATIGANLGVVNTWTTLRGKKVRLLVTPKWGLAPGWTGLSIDVVNLSSFPVTITEIRFTLDRSRSSLPKRVPIPSDAIVQGERVPTTLQPHHSMDVVFEVDWLGSLDIVMAYALTSGGAITRGTSGALKQFRSRGNRVCNQIG